jgi:hypothetical protein
VSERTLLPLVVAAAPISTLQLRLRVGLADVLRALGAVTKGPGKWLTPPGVVGPTACRGTGPRRPPSPREQSPPSPTVIFSCL